MNRKMLMCWVVGVVAGLGLAGSAFAANSLIVNAPGLNGTNFKMAVTLDGSANNVYVETQHPVDESHYLARFWVGRQTLTFPGNTSIRIGAIADDATGQKLILFLKKNPNNTIHLNSWHALDGQPFSFGCTIFLSTTAAVVARQFELEYTQSAGANTGAITLKRIDNSNTCALTGLDMDLFEVDSARFGLLAGSGVNATGTYNFDEFESYR